MRHLVLQMLSFSLRLSINNGWVAHLLSNHFVEHVVTVILPVIFAFILVIL